MYGNFGQANYSGKSTYIWTEDRTNKLAAKLSQVGFTETLAKEGAKYNIIANVIAPIGKFDYDLSESC